MKTGMHMKAENFDHAVEILREMKARKILLQVPDGLKPRVFEFFNKLSPEFNVVISGEAFYGACDIGNYTSSHGIDCVVQLGHSIIPNIEYPIPVIFIEWRNRHSVEFESLSTRVIEDNGYRKIGLLASIQYMDRMKELEETLEKRGFTVLVGDVDGRMAYPGQVLGCNFSAAHSVSGKVDCYILVTTGKFHAIGVQLATEKEAFVLDLNTMELESMKDSSERFIRKRYARISKALDASKFCIAVNTKIGQRRDSLAVLLESQVKKLGKESVVVVTDDVKPTDFENMRCDAVIFTGCPRVSIDDQDKFTMPVLTPPEFQQLFDFRPKGRYVMDEIINVSANDLAKQES